MRGPGGWVKSKRLMAIGLSPLRVCRRSGCSAHTVRRRYVIYNALPEGVNAKGDQRAIADNPECMNPVRWHHDRDARFERNDPFLVVEPRLPTPFDDGQHLCIGMRVQWRRVAWMRGLYAGADWHPV